VPLGLGGLDYVNEHDERNTEWGAKVSKNGTFGFQTLISPLPAEPVCCLARTVEYLAKTGGPLEWFRRL
jgi:hypothetical protein